jgi:hypothetical protein
MTFISKSPEGLMFCGNFWLPYDPSLQKKLLARVGKLTLLHFGIWERLRRRVDDKELDIKKGKLVSARTIYTCDGGAYPPYCRSRWRPFTAFFL